MTTTKATSSYKFVAENPDLEEVLRKHNMMERDSEELKSLKDNGQILCLASMSECPKLFQYYTGLTVENFNDLYRYFERKAKVLKYPYGARTVLFKHHVDANKKKPGKNRTFSLKEEFFFTLIKLKLGLQNIDLATRIGVAPSTFSSIFTAWVTLLALELEKICKLPPTTETDQEESASCFDEFPNVRIIIDCTELFAETPSSIGVHKQFHSTYKHHSTVKFMVGMNTAGSITYISDMFSGRASDKFITNESEDLLNALNPGERVMADRGFTIQENLPLGVQLLIPSFKHKDKSQFSKAELQSNKKISEARVHIERAIRRIKQFHILKNEMKISQVDVYSNIFKACGYLVNFQSPFLKV